MKQLLVLLAGILALHLTSPAAIAQVAPVATPLPDRDATPNVVIVFADDISAREFPVYGSDTWSLPNGGDTNDPTLRGQTPMLDRIAAEGCWITTAWTSTICSPSRAMMMTGRFAHLHQWWHNSDMGRVAGPHSMPIPLYQSSPILIGHVARAAGYASFWSGKTQMKGSDLQLFGFDEGAFTPGEQSHPMNPHTDFRVIQRRTEDGIEAVNLDTGEVADIYPQAGWYWKPHVRLMNHPTASEDFEWWPNTPESQAAFGLNTYGPDVELELIFDFIDRQHAADQPFFVYHTTHLGHDGFDYFHPETESKWPGTPIVTWDESSQTYTRTEPNITGDHGVYNTHGTITEPGIQSHLAYLDYQAWQYIQKFEALGIADNTIFIFCADNGTLRYGKGNPTRQRGVQVPFMVYAPGLINKTGEQDILVSMADILPTLSDIMGVVLPDEYEVNGESLWPYLTTDQTTHRPWIYSYHQAMQLIRGHRVMRDGHGNWWDVETEAADLDSYPPIRDWSQVSPEHRAEREAVEAVLPQFQR